MCKLIRLCRRSKITSFWNRKVFEAIDSFRKKEFRVFTLTISWTLSIARFCICTRCYYIADDIYRQPSQDKYKLRLGIRQ